MGRLLVVLALAAAVLAGCGGGQEPERREPFPVFLQDDAELLHRPPARVAATLDAAREDGMTWIRVTAGWSVIAPQPRAVRRPDFDATDPAAYPPGAWDALDRVVRGAHERGLKVMLDVGFWAPRWAVARPGAAPDRERDRIDAAAFGAFSEAVARRYPDAEGFTVYNEPNFGLFLLPQYDAAGRAAAPDVYRAMVRAALPAIRSVAPRALVLIGATAAVGDDADTARDARMTPLRFLRELACVDADFRPLRTPACRDFTPLPGDGWSHHPYGLDGPPGATSVEPEDVRMGDLPRLVAALRRLHAMGRTERELGVWVTEFGYQTDPPDPTRATSLAEQAQRLPEALRIARATDGVRSFAQFLLRDLPERDGPTLRDRWCDFQSGLRFADGRPKPAEDALRRALRAAIR